MVYRTKFSNGKYSQWENFNYYEKYKEYVGEDKRVFVYKCKIPDFSIYKTYWGIKPKITLQVDNYYDTVANFEKTAVFYPEVRMPSYDAEGACAFIKSKKVNQATITARVNRNSYYNYFKIVRNGKIVSYGYIPDATNTVKQKTKNVAIPYEKNAYFRVYFGVKKKDQKPKYSKEYITKKVRSKKIYPTPAKTTKLKGGKVGIDAIRPYGTSYYKIQRYNSKTKTYKTIKTLKNSYYFVDKNPFKTKRYRVVAYKKANNKTYKRTGDGYYAYANQINLGGNPGTASQTMKFRAGMGTVKYSGNNIYVKVTVTNSTYYITRRLSSIRVKLKVGKTTVFDRKFKRSRKMGPRGKVTYTLKITNPKYVNLRHGKITYGAWAYGN